MNVVIFDIPRDINLVKSLISHFQVHNIYIYAFSPVNAYMVGKPSRSDFAEMYKYLLGHGSVPLAGNEQALADYFKMPKGKLNLIVEVMIEAGLVNWHNQDLVTIPVSEKVDLLATQKMQDWQLQIEGERFLLYNDIKSIKDYFYSGGKDGF